MLSDNLCDETGRLCALERYNALGYASEASFKQITSLMQTILGLKMVSVSLVTKDKQVLKARQGFDLKETARSDAFCDITIQGYEPLVVEDTHEDERLCDNPYVTGDPFVRCYIGAPLTTTDGYNIGTVCAFDTYPRKFNSVERKIVTKFADLIINQFELRNIADRDFLTQLPNRRNFEAGMQQELVRLSQNNGAATLVMIDIDHFKQVNDRLGHPSGDRVLREFATILANNCRANDLVARLGGEEFAVLLQNTTIENARIWADRMREEVAAARFDGENGVHVTISMGLAALDGKVTPFDVVSRLADNALFAAKRQGRNRVVAA
ncbi:MAG: diguanylate cyclase [Pelagibaca sp.]